MLAAAEDHGAVVAFYDGCSTAEKTLPDCYLSALFISYRQTNKPPCSAPTLFDVLRETLLELS
jgi:hypothetical protein